jgi:hypothetical protein
MKVRITSIFFDTLDAVYTWGTGLSQAPRKSRGFESHPFRFPRKTDMKSIVTQIGFRVAGLGIVPITTSCSRTTAREDHSERPGGTKHQFAVTNRRSGRYGNTSRIWPSRSFRCTLRQKSG